MKKRDSESKSVEETLARADLHDAWDASYRSPQSERFFDRALDTVTRAVAAPPEATFLDAGCGACTHSIRLARRGYRVHAVDFSDTVLEEARQRVHTAGLHDRITIERQNLLALTFPDATFDYALCWGVLMHIPEIETAIAELARVLRPGGKLVVSEANVASVEQMALQSLRRVLRKQVGVRSQAGIEHWFDTPAGPLLARQTNMGWLVERFAENNLALTRRMPGQFTELYTRFSSPLVTGLIHSWNAFWFRRVQAAGPAFGNILIFEKQL